MLTDFTLPNGRRFYLSMGNPLGVKGLTVSTSEENEYRFFFSENQNKQTDLGLKQIDRG